MKRLFALLLVSVLVLSMTACNVRDTQQVEDDDEDIVQTDDVPSSNEEKEEPTEHDGPLFWLNRQDWDSIPEGSFDGTLFSINMPAPISLDQLDPYAAPYHWFPDQTTLERVEIDSISQVTSSTLEIDGRREGHPVQIYSKHDVGCIGNIYVLNYLEDRSYDDRMLTVGECAAKNWWYMELSMSRMFGLESSTGYFGEEGGKAILDTFGKPTCVRVQFEDAVEGLKNNEGAVGYELVYELDGFVLTFSVYEEISETDSSLNISNCTYYTDACWEKVKPAWHVLDI